MMRNDFNRLIMVVILAVLLVPCQIFGNDTPPDAINKAAKKGVEKFIKGSRFEDLQRFGFKNKKEINGTDVSDGFRVYTIQPNDLLNGKVAQDLQSLARPTDQWEYLVVNGSNAYALLTVDIVNGEWEPVSIGESELAKELNDILHAWPSSSEYQYRFISVFKAKSDFIVISQGKNVLGVIPLISFMSAISTGKSNTFNSNTLVDPDKILSELRSLVK